MYYVVILPALRLHACTLHDTRDAGTSRFRRSRGDRITPLTYTRTYLLCLHSESRVSCNFQRMSFVGFFTATLSGSNCDEPFSKAVTSNANRAKSSFVNSQLASLNVKKRTNVRIVTGIRRTSRCYGPILSDTSGCHVRYVLKTCATHSVIQRRIAAMTKHPERLVLVTFSAAVMKMAKQVE